MPNFANGKIYRINIGDHFYIGSTTLSLNQRLSNHKQDMFRTSRLYTTMREAQGDVIMWLVEEFPCTTRAELTARETFHILQHRDNPMCLNMRLSHRTPEEIIEYRKQYRVQRASAIKQYREQKIECECGAHITAGNIATHRKSRAHHWNMQMLQQIQQIAV